MNILITGARGFVGKNLCQTLKHTHTIWEFHRETSPETLEIYCEKADFVFHLAGVNRAETAEAYWEGNVRLTQKLLEALKRHGNQCPVVYASSVHAAGETVYGRSKRAAEALVLAHGGNTAVYRLPNLFGKWCRPNYNSVVATFCHNIAHDLPICVNDEEKMLELAYIDDVIAEFHCALAGKKGLCTVPVTYQVSVGQIAERLQVFHRALDCLVLPPMDAFDAKLYAAFLSYLPPEKARLKLTMHKDDRGSFTELLRPDQRGQLSVNVIKPGMCKGQHWHHSKWELFTVVSGEGLIRQRRVDGDQILEFPVSGETPETVRILPGYIHSLENLSQAEDLVTVIWASEWFDPERPDTFYAEV